MSFRSFDGVLTPEVIAFVGDALAKAPRWKDFLAITFPAQYEAPEKFLRIVPRDGSFLWRAHLRDQFAAGGVTARIAVSGHDRFTQLSRTVPELFSRIASASFDGPPPPPILVGGAAFAPSQPAHEPWDEFGEDEFILPRWGYRRQRDTATLTLTLGREELNRPGLDETILDELLTLTAQLEHERSTSFIERLAKTEAVFHHLPAEDWNAYIDAIKAAFATGEFTKIVACRRCVVDLKRSLEDTSFMARIFAAYPECTHFALRRKQATFLGATPETLFRKIGNSVHTEALAGTTRVPDEIIPVSNGTIDQLTSSEKDRHEHALVVQRIASELGPLTTRLEYPDVPETRRVRNLVHLRTPITGTLRPETNVFDVLAALHPTPAVGGFPAREAAEWICQNEPMERGWYTGVVGWFDAAGDGEFAVAIRCGVLKGRRAFIYAGAGIVEASDPDAEYAETAAKMAPLLRALGVNA